MSKKSKKSQEIIEKLYKIKAEQEKIGQENLRQKNYLIAYLAYWSIIEQSAKIIGEYLAKKKLKKRLNDWVKNWKNHIDGKIKDPPNDIKFFTFKFENRIPSESVIKEFTILVPLVKKILKSDGKYRKMRNSIAHRGKPQYEIKNEETYKAYIADLKKGIKDIFDSLEKFFEKN